MSLMRSQHVHAHRKGVVVGSVCVGCGGFVTSCLGQQHQPVLTSTQASDVHVLFVCLLVCLASLSLPYMPLCYQRRPPRVEKPTTPRQTARPSRTVCGSLSRMRGARCACTETRPRKPAMHIRKSTQLSRCACVCGCPSPLPGCGVLSRVFASK